MVLNHSIQIVGWFNALTIWKKTPSHLPRQKISSNCTKLQPAYSFLNSRPRGTPWEQPAASRQRKTTLPAERWQRSLEIIVIQLVICSFDGKANTRDRRWCQWYQASRLTWFGSTVSDVWSEYLPTGASVLSFITTVVVCPLRKLPNVGCAGHKCMGCKQQSLLGPALHDKSRVHPRNFHNLHLNICLEHHGMEGTEEMQLFFCASEGLKMKNPFNYPTTARSTGQLCFMVSGRKKIHPQYIDPS